MTTPDPAATVVDDAMDYEQLFTAVPVACLVLGPDLVIVDANDSYLQLTGRDRHALLGRSLAQAFPDDAGGRRSVTTSLQRVLASGQADRLPLVRFDVRPEQGVGPVQQRWWSAVNVPVLDAWGDVTAILQVVDDVTTMVQARQDTERQQAVSEDLRLRTQALQSQLSTHSEQLVLAAAAQATAARRLSALAEAALALAGAESEADLVEVIFNRGLSALGADGGGVTVRREDEEGLRLTVTTSLALGEATQRIYGEPALDDPLPGPVVAQSGQVLLLGDQAAGLAFHPQMAQVYADTGRSAWATLPLRVGTRLLGALSVGWQDPRDFDPLQVELLEVFAAQCAQTLDRLLARQVERDTARTSRKWSEALQRSLLTEPPELQDLAVAVRYHPAAQQAQVGGDWYDAFTALGDIPTLVVGDVTGHDREAAVEMGQVRGVLRGVAQTVEQPPSKVLSAFDHALHALAGRSGPVPITAVLCQVHTTTAAPGAGAASDQVDVHHVAHWSNAGHPPPLYISPTGVAELLDGPEDLLLGVDPDTDRRDHEVDLPPGATLVLYSDGLIERREESLHQGLERLRDAARGGHRLPVGDLCDNLLQHLAGDTQDDIALLVLRAQPSAAGVEHPRGTGIGDGLAGRTVDVREPTIDSLTGTTVGKASQGAVSLTLPCRPGSVRAARAFVQSVCTDRHVDADLGDLAVLLTSETVTNALTHGRSDPRLSITTGAHRLRVEVGDDNPSHPRRVDHDLDALSGRGVQLLDLLAADWGVHDLPDGKAVWFEVALP